MNKLSLLESKNVVTPKLWNKCFVDIVVIVVRNQECNTKQAPGAAEEGEKSITLNTKGVFLLTFATVKR